MRWCREHGWVHGVACERCDEEYGQDPPDEMDVDTVETEETT